MLASEAPNFHFAAILIKHSLQITIPNALCEWIMIHLYAMSGEMQSRFHVTHVCDIIH